MVIYHSPRPRATESRGDLRIRIVSIVLMIAFVLIGIRLFFIMVVQHAWYTALATGSHEMYAQLFPTRGDIYVQDSRTGEEFPLAINRDLFTLFADTSEIHHAAEKANITQEKMAEDIVQQLASIFAYDDEKKLAVYTQLLKEDDPYEPIEQKVDEEKIEHVQSLKLPGIHFTRRPFRFYPEGNLASQVSGFVGKDEQGNDVGRYGIEGYWDAEISGNGGFLEGVRSAKGRWIPLAGRLFKPATDGPDIKLTIDRTIQFKGCEYLRQYKEEYGAQSASLIIMEPETGAIRAMCNVPDFDPNQYGSVDSADSYNNATIFTAYEPGSIFKPIGMAGAIHDEVIKPESVFHDSGSVVNLCITPITNAQNKTYGDQTMTGVLENSINTGMVYVVRQLGKDRFVKYVKDFGFGLKTGIELDTESSGTVETLSIKNGNEIDCYAATASFGQGITVTPLQMTSAYAAIANGGKLMKPYIVEELRYPDGTVKRTKPEEVRQVISKRASALVSSMLVSVVEKGFDRGGKVEGYYLAGKTGTAQIAGPGGYTSDTNHSFVGFGPVDNPKFVVFIKFEKPKRAFASLTTAPVFSRIAKFMLDYYQIPPSH